MKFPLLIQCIFVLIYDGAMAWFFGMGTDYLQLVLISGNIVIGPMQLISAIYRSFHEVYQKKQLIIYLIVSLLIIGLMIVGANFRIGYDLFWPLMIVSWIMANVYVVVLWSLIGPKIDLGI